MTRGPVLQGRTHKIVTGCGHLYITINYNKEGIPIEVFVRLGKAGGCAASQSEAVGRLITLALQAGVTMEEIVHQLLGVGCHLPAGFGDAKTLSCADAVARCLRREAIGHEVIGQEVKVKEEPKPVESKPKEDPKLVKRDVLKEVQDLIGVVSLPQKSGACPDCGARVAIEEGCEKCHVCGYTKCG